MKVMNSGFMINQYRPISFKGNGINLDDPIMKQAISTCQSYLDKMIPVEYGVFLQKDDAVDDHITYSKICEVKGKRQVSLQGMQNRINIPDEVLTDLTQRAAKGENIVFVHGHPQNRDGSTGPVSPRDYLTAARIGISEVIAVNKAGEVSRVVLPAEGALEIYNKYAQSRFWNYVHTIPRNQLAEFTDSFWQSVARSEPALKYETHSSFFQKKAA